MFIVNNLILHTLNDDSFETNNLIMKTFAQLFFENNEFIMNNGLLKLKIWTDQFIGLLKNFNNSYWIPFQIIYSD
jgi:hypothetical protein